jgi:RNA polymerase sigma-70 factor (family 1)
MFSPQSYDDQALLSMLKASDDTALTYIYDRYWKQLYLSAFSIIREAGPCEDIVQDVLFRLWLRRADVSIAALRPYLFTAVRYQVFSYIRSANRRKVFVEPGELERLAGMEDLEGRLNERDVDHLLHLGIAALPERCKEVFLLSRKEHLSNKEIAVQMGISIKTVEAQMTIALKQLRMNMGEVLFSLFILLSLFR